MRDGYLEVEKKGKKKGKKNSKKTTYINRLEVNTNFDFGKIQQVMVCETRVPCPLKPGFEFVTVLLQCGACFLLLGHVYPVSWEGRKTAMNQIKQISAKKLKELDPENLPGAEGAKKKKFEANPLKDWVFVNNKNEEVEARVE